MVSVDVKHHVYLRDSPTLIVLMVSVDEKQHWNIASELRRCGEVEVAVLGSPSLIALTVSVDVKLSLNLTSEASFRLLF